MGGNVSGLGRRDRDLVDELDRADPGVQRVVAVWAARRACEVAEIASTDWVAAGLDALAGAAAAFAGEEQLLFDEVRNTFPSLGHPPGLGP